MNAQIKFVEFPIDGRPRRDLPPTASAVIDAMLKASHPTGWADFQILFPNPDDREAVIRRLRRHAIVATASNGRYVRVLRLK